MKPPSECLACAFHCPPASGFPPVLPAAVDKFRFVAVPRSSTRVASGNLYRCGQGHFFVFDPVPEEKEHGDGERKSN